MADNYNFRWICTQGGLARFDGTNFFNFTAFSDRRYNLKSGDIKTAIPSADGRFIYTLAGIDGISKINIQTNIVESTINMPNRQNGNYAYTFAIVEDSIYLPSHEGLYVYHSKTGWKKKALPITITDLDCKHIMLAGNKIFMTANNYGIVEYETKIGSIKLLAEDPLYNKNISGLESIGGKTFFACSYGIFSIDENNVEQIVAGDISCMEKGNRANIFYATKEGLFSKELNGETPTMLVDIDESGIRSWQSSINTIFMDTEENLWLGGVSCLALLKKSMLGYNNHIGSPDYHINHTSRIFATDNKLFVGEMDGLKVFEKVTNRLLFFKENAGRVSGIFAFGQDTLISFSNQLTLFSNNELRDITSKYPEWKQYANVAFNSLLDVSPQVYLLGAENNTGAYLWNKKDKQVKNLKDAIKGFPNVNNITKDGVNRYWVLSNNIITILDSNLKYIKEIELNQLPNAVSAVLMNALYINNKIFVAAYGWGLLEFDEKFNLTNVVSKKEGLTDFGVYELLPEGDSAIYISTNNGLFRYSLISKNVLHRLKSNGLHNNTFEEFAAYKHNNEYYFGGMEGITMFKPSTFGINTIKPTLFFDKILIKKNKDFTDSVNIWLEGLDVPSNSVQTLIKIGSIDFISPENINIQYRISQFSEQWLEVGGDRTISLIGTPPGKYLLEVRAINADGVVSAPIFLTLNFLPKWHQTWWFKLLVLASVVGILWMLYRFRINQLKKVFAVRQKISRDLHDDIGGTLSSIKMYSEVAQSQSDQTDIIAHIEDNAKEVIEKLDDIVWANNPKNDSIEHLCQRIEGFARPLLRSKGIVFSFSQPIMQHHNTIDSLARQSVYLVLKEAISNAAKYAECTQIKVDIAIHNKKIACLVQDNGSGFDASKPTNRNGLLNMRQRIEDLKGRFQIMSILGEGTKVEFEVPV